MHISKLKCRPDGAKKKVILGLLLPEYRPAGAFVAKKNKLPCY
jgi:hypothetical protein